MTWLFLIFVVASTVGYCLVEDSKYPELAIFMCIPIKASIHGFLLTRVSRFGETGYLGYFTVVMFIIIFTIDINIDVVNDMVSAIRTFRKKRREHYY